MSNFTSKTKVVVIVGPTASGKSDLAVELARLFQGEIISADSRQVYKGLDIGSGKITPKEMRGVPHHLLDVIDPRRSYSAAQYRNDGEKSLKDIFKKNKLPIICGGTGLYIDTLLGTINLPEVAPNKILRKKLEKLSVQKLYTLLKKKDPRRAQEIDRHNPVRLIRALEIVGALGKVPEQLKLKSMYEVLFIGLFPGEKKLKENINLRFKKRIKQGMIDEVKKLHSNGLSFKRLEELGLEYRFIAFYLQKKISKTQLEKELQTAIWHYAKRQMTWWKKNKKIQWFQSEKTDDIKKVVEEFLKY